MNFLYRRSILTAVLLLCVLLIPSARASFDDDPMNLPQIGENTLRVISPKVLELVLINTKLPDPARVTSWDFIDAAGVLHLPALSEFSTTVNGQTIIVQSVSFKRRVLYAPLNKRDLRICNSIFLTLASPVGENQTVEVKNPSGNLWSNATKFIQFTDPLRYSPAIHVNELGYMPNFSKKAMVGYFLGTSQELLIATNTTFTIQDAVSHTNVFQGKLTLRKDVGFTCSPLPYQSVMEADFSALNTTGEYYLVVPGMGASFSFMIHDGIASAFTRSYALGIYHQRCGTGNDLPYTRHTHGPCHTGQSDVPTASFSNTWSFIASASADYTNNVRHTAPQLKNPTTLRYPFVRQGKVDVSGGHHDAGDYSKYTINSAMFIHSLVFAADTFPGVGQLDNLGLPESGDGRSDLLQEAKWEADFLAKMQDSDGGFYFLVYPRDRKYEWNVTPDHGDPQVVWPKTTAVTASSVGALAEIGSSPLFKQQFPVESALYLLKAKAGWDFLERAIANYGKDGSYQKITHYGNSFMHNDELCWAASAMFVATGNPYYQQKLMEWLPNPNDPTTRQWTWLKLFEGYGCAIRTYAFAVRSVRLNTAQVFPDYLAKCEAEVKLAGQDQLQRTKDSAYGTCFPAESKRYMQPGWYFSLDQAFDMSVAYQLDSNTNYIDAIVQNMNFELGCNPNNISFLTGVGLRQQHEIVHQYAQNDRRALPPMGIPLGNLQTSFQWMDKYKTSTGANELMQLSFFADAGNIVNPYPIYDRWGDSYNVKTEFVNVNQSRSLACVSFLMARSKLKTQTWNSSSLQIAGMPSLPAANQQINASVQIPGIDLTGAVITWEASGQRIGNGATFSFTPTNSGPQWIEADVLLPDGRHTAAAKDFTISAPTNSPVPPPSQLPTLSFKMGKTTLLTTGDNTSITVSRSGATTSALTLRYTIGGTAIYGADYTLSGSAVIPAGATSTTLTATATAKAFTTLTVKTVVLTLLGDPSYATPPQTLTILLKK